MTDSSPPDRPNFGRLRQVQIIAVITGALTLSLSLYLMGQFSNPELVPIIIAVALTGIGFSAVFYFGCLFFEGSLQKYIVSDDTVIKGQTVEMQTKTRDSGDPQIDEWVGRYVFARNLFGMSVIPLLLLGGILLFG